MPSHFPSHSQSSHITRTCRSNNTCAHRDRPPSPPDNRKESTKDLALIFPAHLAAHSAKLRSMRVYPCLSLSRMAVQQDRKKGTGDKNSHRSRSAQIVRRPCGRVPDPSPGTQETLPSHLFTPLLHSFECLPYSTHEQTHEQVPDLYLSLIHI